MDARDEILRLTDGGRHVFNAFWPGEGIEISRRILHKKKLKNPFYDDHNASVSVYRDKKTGKFYFNDWGDPRYKGDCFWFVGMTENLDPAANFRQILQIIVKRLNLNVSLEGACEWTSIKGSVLPEGIRPKKPKPQRVKQYDYKTLDWNAQSIRYWEKYAITKDTLLKYRVFPLMEYTTENDAGQSYVVRATPISPMYGYVFDKFVKIYRPLEDIRFRSIGTFPQQYCFGWKQLPAFGDLLFITGGEKDVLSLASQGFFAICFQNENATVPENIIELVRPRFKYIIIMYDCDETGLRRMDELATQYAKYNIYTLVLPLSGTKPDKDISDYFASGKRRKDLRDLVRNLLAETVSATRTLVESCKVDLSIPVEPSTIVISAGDVPLGAYDNLLCITGGVGTGKSNFIGALIAGALVTKDCEIDTLGVKVTPNYNRKAVLHFDTEQSENQLKKNDKISLMRAGLTDEPDFFYSAYLTPSSLEERLAVIRGAMDTYNLDFDGIHLVVIDGVADLIQSPNDEGSSNDMVRELSRLAGIYHTCIICVVHTLQNTPKLRGHIGSELMRKAAAIISIEKDDDTKSSFMKALKVREGNPYSVPLLTFAWSEAAGMLVGTGQKSEDFKVQFKKDDLARIAAELFESQDEYDYKSLRAAIIEKMEVRDRTAKYYIAFMKENGILDQNSGKQYILKK